MQDLIPEIKKVTEEFLSSAQKLSGDNLVSVILTGPAARGEVRKEPYINFLVILKDNTPSEIAPFTVLKKKLYKQNIKTPLFLTEKYIEESSDVFPLEFLEMSLSYKVIFGEDPFNKIEFSHNDIRNQCEREIKGKLIHLRTKYFNHRDNPKDLAGLITRSFDTFRLVFSGALFLKEIKIPVNTKEMLESIIKNYALDRNVFDTLTGYMEKGIKSELHNIDILFDKYVEEMDKLSKIINSMNTMEEK